MNVHTGSTPSGISYMQAPAYPNLMDINTAVKGTVEELLKKHHHKTKTYTPSISKYSGLFLIVGISKYSGLFRPRGQTTTKCEVFMFRFAPIFH